LGAAGSSSAQTPEAPPPADNAHAKTTPETANNRFGAAMPNPQQTPTPPPRPAPDLLRLGVDTGRNVTLTLNEAIRRALENNNDIEVARDDVRLAETQLRVLQGIFDPVFSFSPSYARSTRPQGSSLGGAGSSGTVSSTSFTYDTAVTKQFDKNGVALTGFFNNTRQTTSSSFSTFSPSYSSNFGVQLSMPLWRGRKIDNTRRQIRVQRKILEQSDADFRRRTIEVISQVQNAYWDLVFALRDQENRLANLNLTRENLRRVEARIAAGDAAPLARAEVLTELANREADVLTATQTVSIAENNLKQLLLRDAQAPDWGAQFVPTDKPNFDESPVSLPDALTEARANRPEMRRLQLARDINDIDQELFKDQSKPRVDLTASYANTGLAGSALRSGAVTSPLIAGSTAANTNADAFLLNELNRLRVLQGLPALTPPAITTDFSPPADLIGGYGQNLLNTLKFKTNEYTVGVRIELPFRNKVAQANLAAAQISRHQIDTLTRQTEQVIELEVRNAAQALETARRRVLTAREARKNAELQLVGEQKLYQVGRSTTFLLFQRENALANARNAELRAETDYNKALANLQRATSTTLTANNVVIDTPTAP
jgi:HAE1 family hydrophobic/amphiphilic exporter-1